MQRLVMLAALAACAVLSSAASAATYYVAPTGSDTAAGTLDAPWRTFQTSLPRLAPGDTLVARGGTYTEAVSATVQPATAAAKTTVVAYTGERPVISGKLWIIHGDYWTLDGINVTWGPGPGPSDQMVRFPHSSFWRLTHSELWGAHSTAALGINADQHGFYVDQNYIHDTYPSNNDQQDHLIYCEADALYGPGNTGVIERNILAGSPNGRAVKIGKGSGSTAPTGGITVRYNTMVDNRGPSQIQLSYGATGNLIYRNIFQGTKLSPTGVPFYPNVTRFVLAGTGTVAADNIGWQSTAVLDVGPSLTDGGGNLHIDPQLDSTWHPQNPAAQTYGRYGSEADTTPPDTTIVNPPRDSTRPGA